jgi:hypothetical protein
VCSYRLIATLPANAPDLHCGQGFLHGDLQSFHYHLADTHTQYPKIGEDIEFPKMLSVKQFSEKTWKLIN